MRESFDFQFLLYAEVDTLAGCVGGAAPVSFHSSDISECEAGTDSMYVCGDSRTGDRFSLQASL